MSWRAANDPGLSVAVCIKNADERKATLTKIALNIDKTNCD